MVDTPSKRLLADAVLVLHFSIVVFAGGGLVFVVVGNLRPWSWVNSVWFRLTHLIANGVVVGERPTAWR